MKITKDMWEKALEHLETMKQAAIEIGWTGIFYIQGCNELKQRYNDGERTKELYNEIMDLH